MNNRSELTNVLHAKAPSATAAAVSPEPLAMWTRSDDKLLEMLIVRYFPPQWDIIASHLVGKTPEQALQRYEHTVHEVTNALQALQVDTPRDMQIDVAASPAVVVPDAAAADVTTVASSAGEEALAGTENKALVPASSLAAAAETSELGGTKRKKPEKWTKKEHSIFLEGLAIYGKGKWKAMSSEYLTTKTANQIASHHQKYCKRLEQRERNGCKRASIHDITEPTSAAAADGEKDELVGGVEEFPGQDDLGTLFT